MWFVLLQENQVKLTELIPLQVLFNDTIKHNIQYGRLSATDEEVRCSSNTQRSYSGGDEKAA